MDEEEEFYIILPSNVSSVTDKENTTSCYKTFLPKTLELRGNWKVALVEIDIPFTWSNVTKHDANIAIGLNNNVYNLNVAQGFYDDLSLITKIINLFNKVGSKSMLRRELDYCELSVAKGESVLFKNRISSMLGFSQNFFDNINGEENKRFTSNRVIDMQAGMYNAFIYSDIVKDTLVGNQYIPLLRSVPIHVKEYGDIHHFEFSHPHYMSLQMNSISEIEIKLCDSTGSQISFLRGNSLVKLHFKKWEE